jgi:Rrf2 family nitric oxide-sensitive transcriptional repressor
MQLRRETDFALRALVYFAVRSRAEGGSDYMSAARAADFCEVSKSEFDSACSLLVAKGYVAIRRGPRGDVRLLVDPAQISLGQIVEDLEGVCKLLYSEAAPSDEPRNDLERRLRRTLRWVGRDLTSYLDQYTLEQMLPPQDTLEASSSRPRLQVVR